MKVPAMLFSAALAVTAVPAAGAPLEEGRMHYEKGEYAHAHDRFLAAARQGDPLAQEYLGFMYAVGPQLFPGVHQDLTAAAQWFARAAQNGRPVSQYAYCALLRRRTLHQGSPLPCFPGDPR